MVVTTAIHHGDRLIRSGLALVLDREPDITVVGEADTPDQIVSLCGEQRPDAVVMQIDSTEWDAPRLAADLHRRQRTLRCVGLHGSLLGPAAQRAHQAGVRITVPYSAGTEGVIAAVRGLGATRPVTTSMPPRVAPSCRPTQREIDVLCLIATGMITREIAEDLGIAVKSVENHKQRIFRKLDVRNQAHAVSIAIRRGVIPPAAITGRA